MKMRPKKEKKRKRFHSIDICKKKPPQDKPTLVQHEFSSSSFPYIKLKIEKNMSRRGSLAISALLNEDTIDPLKTDHHLRSASRSPIKSGSTSPISSQHQEQQETLNQSQLSKSKRKRISPAQYNRLMEIFDQTDTPSSEIRENLAIELNMTKREVQVCIERETEKRKVLFTHSMTGLVSKQKSENESLKEYEH